jgi:hypothetical protein
MRTGFSATWYNRPSQISAVGVKPEPQYIKKGLRVSAIEKLCGAG